MSLLTQASLVLTPNAVKTSKLYSIIPSNGNGDMTVVRATTATRVNSLGLIESVAANVPRLNYDGGCPSILVEPLRTNRLLNSEMFSDVSWVKAQSTITINTINSPSGTLTADTLTANGVALIHNLGQNFSFIINTSYTFSVYLKANTNNFAQLVFPGGGFSAQSFVNFDLINGVLGTIGSAATATIINMGNGWYRCSATATCNNSITQAPTVVIITSSTSIRNEANSLTTSLYVWGTQLEEGSYPTSYIPTTTVTTRNADVITRNNVYTNNLITSLGGTLFLELNNNLSLTRTVAGNGIWIGDNNTGSTNGNSLNIRHNGGTARLDINKTIGGTLFSLYTTLTNTVKIAIDWNGTTADVFVNGVKVVTGTAFTTTNMEFLNIDGLGDVPKYIKSMMLFPKPLTDSECIALTTL